MLLLFNKLQLAASFSRPNLIRNVMPVKYIHPTVIKYEETYIDKNAGLRVPPSKDRSQIIPLEISIKYLKSAAYKETYGNDPVWKLYRRNFKGHFLPRKTRKMCIRGGVVSTGSPCPICRDEYLIVDYRNIDLIKQFISEHDGRILHYNFTNVCQRAHKDICVAIMKAKELGLITYDVSFRYYNYSECK